MPEMEDEGRYMIKRYHKSSADTDLLVAKDIRPPPVLLQTLVHLEEHVMSKLNDGIHDTLQVYLFLFDRIRAISQDFIMQRYKDGLRSDSEAIECHERMARWLIAMQHRMCFFDEFVRDHKQQNQEQLSKLLLSMNLLYFDKKTGVLSQNTPEIASYYILYHLPDVNSIRTSYLRRLPGILFI